MACLEEFYELVDSEKYKIELIDDFNEKDKLEFKIIFNEGVLIISMTEEYPEQLPTIESVFDGFNNSYIQLCLNSFFESNQDQQNILLKTIEYFDLDVLPDLIQDKSDRVLNARAKIRTGSNDIMSSSSSETENKSEKKNSVSNEFATTKLEFSTEHCQGLGIWVGNGEDCNGPQDPELENALSKLLKRGCHFTFGGFQYNIKYFSKQKFEEVLRDWKYYPFHNSHDIKVPTGCRTNNVCIKITHPAHDESFCTIRDKLEKCKSAASHFRGGHRRAHIQCGALSCLEQLDEALAKLTPTERNQKVKKISRTKKKQNLIKNSI